MRVVVIQAICEEICEEIAEGVLRPGDPLAGAVELARAFDCAEEDAAVVLDLLVSGFHAERTRDGDYRVARNPGVDPELAPAKRRGRRPAKSTA